MLTIQAIQKIYMKLGKKIPDTQMCFCTNSCHTELTRTPSLLLTHSLSTSVGSEQTITTVLQLLILRTVKH